MSISNDKEQLISKIDNFIQQGKSALQEQWFKYQYEYIIKYSEEIKAYIDKIDDLLNNLYLYIFKLFINMNDIITHLEEYSSILFLKEYMKKGQSMKPKNLYKYPIQKIDEIPNNLNSYKEKFNRYNIQQIRKFIIEEFSVKTHKYNFTTYIHDYSHGESENKDESFSSDVVDSDDFKESLTGDFKDKTNRRDSKNPKDKTNPTNIINKNINIAETL